MKNRIIKYFAVVIALMTITTSCLDKMPESAVPVDEAMQSYNDAEQTVTGIYSMMKSSALWSGLITLLPDIQTDLVYAVDGYSNTYGQHWLWNVRSTNSEVEAVYASLYGIISNCNFYLERIDEVIAKQTSDEYITILEQYTGEVYTIRALCYSELLRFYCKAYDPAIADEPNLGVVIRQHYSTPERSVRATLRQSYGFVISDLEKAEELLDPDYDAYSSYYMTNAVAHALHARVALYMQDWESAIEHSTEVIGRDTHYILDPANIEWNGGMTYFDRMWCYDNSYETLWQVGFTPTSMGGALGQVFLNFTNDYAYYYPDYVPAQWVLDLYVSGDMRYNSYFATLSTGYDHGLQWPLLVKYYGNQDFISNYIYHVTMPKPFRLAEQYLIRAEAYCRQQTPDFSRASRDISTLREARFSSGGSLSLSAENFIEQIANERVRELYMEGHRLQDIKRWGNLYKDGEGFTRTPQKNSLAEGSNISIKANDPRLVWPIPQHELEAPGSEVVKNESNN